MCSTSWSNLSLYYYYYLERRTSLANCIVVVDVNVCHSMLVQILLSLSSTIIIITSSSIVITTIISTSPIIPTVNYYF